MTKLRIFSQTGMGLLEYALLVSLIAVGAVLYIGQLSNPIKGKFCIASDALEGGYETIRWIDWGDGTWKCVSDPQGGWGNYNIIFE